MGLFSAKQQRLDMAKPRSTRSSTKAGFEALDHSTAEDLRNIGTMKPSGEAFTIEPSLLYLTDVERAEIQAFRVRVMQLRQESEKRKLARAFRILALPPEARVRIFEYAFQQDRANKQVLAFTATPRVARVCKTFRMEALPLFFAETEFIVPVESNFEHRAGYRKKIITSYPRERTTDAFYQKRCGVLNIKMPVKKAIRDAGDDAIFRNIVLQAFDSIYPTFDHGGIPPHLCVVEVRLSVRRGQLLVDATEKDAHPASTANRFPSRATESQDVNIVIDALRRIAADVSSKEGFKGLKLRDLERMVKVFRFTEPTTRTVGDAGDKDAEA